MTLDIIPKTDITPARWDALVNVSPDGFVFALTQWLEVSSGVSEWGFTDKSFGITNGNRLVGVLPLQLNTHQQILSSGGWGGSGPVIAGDVSPKARKRIITAMMQQVTAVGRDTKATSFDFWLPSATETSRLAPWGVNPYMQYGMDDISGTSRVIDLTVSEEKLWRGLSKTTKHAVRDAKNAGFSVTPLSWEKALDDYYEIHKENYARTGVSPHPKSFFSGIATKTAPQGNHLLFGVHDVNNRVVGYHNAAVLNDKGFYQTGCSKYEALKTGANYLLFWETLLSLKQSGVAYYDCGEVFPGTTATKSAGLSTFKSKFGGENHRFFKCRKDLGHVEQPNFKPEAYKLLKQTQNMADCFIIKPCRKRLISKGKQLLSFRNENSRPKTEELEEINLHKFTSVDSDIYRPEDITHAPPPKRMTQSTLVALYGKKFK